MRRFGIEVEYKFGPEMTYDNVIAALEAQGLQVQRVNSHVGFHETKWTVKRDGSISEGFELCSPPLDFDDPEQREQVTKAIFAAQNSNCLTDPLGSIHVHIEGKNFDGTLLTGRQLGSVVRWCYKFEDAIYRIGSSGWETLREGARTFAKPLPESTTRAIMNARSVEDVRKVWDGDQRRNERPRNGATRTRLWARDRYSAVNLRSFFDDRRRTIEFRYCNNSLNPERVQTYVAFFMAIVDDARYGFSRSVKKSYPLGSMLDGKVSEKALFLRLQQVLRSESADTKVLMSEQDWKRLRKVVWNGSRPQSPAIFRGWVNV